MQQIWKTKCSIMNNYANLIFIWYTNLTTYDNHDNLGKFLVFIQKIEKPIKFNGFPAVDK